MMKIDEIFERRIDRIIEGVIKADDDEHLFEEIDEYVITNEINQRLSEFLDYYNDYQVVNGAWISGFFGSGKSHLLKILSYVLENRLLLDDLPAAEIFLEKLKDDALLKGQMEKAISIPSRSILFNIDQKADVVSKKETDAVLSVFMKVFNDLRGYDPKIPHIAQFEYDMDRQGCYGAFKEAFLEISGKPWEEAREYVWLEAGEFIAALSRVKGMTEEEATKTLDRYEHTYQLSIEDFASQVKDYIDNQGPGFRLNIFVDEVGQYIADNVKLMTNLQTIAESLATKCRGQAWLIVTSQEDMDDVIGEVGGRQSNDFSKIQDRLKCRMKLTSKNVAEVIQRRLLQKKTDVISDLALLYEKEKNNLKTLFEFRDSGRTYRHFQSEEDFVACYPFMPYHFELLQSAIKGLSEHNAFEGKFRSVGERSMLGVFQEVAKRIAEKKVGHLASFDLMFDGIQTALKSQIQTDILSAERTLSLQPLAVRVLKALLMVKYVREFKANPRNISILLIDRFDVDPIGLEEDVKKALDLLEKNTYLRRSGDLYEYLTDDEKDVEAEIKNVDVDQSEINKFLVDIIYHSILKDSRIRYEEKEKDYPFNKLIDDSSYGYINSDLSINVITPFHKNYGDKKAQAMRSIQGNELVLMLDADPRLIEDLYLNKKTEKYCRIHQGEVTKDNIRRILSEKTHQYEEMKSDLEARIKEAIAAGTCFLRGDELDVPLTDPRLKILGASQYLVSASYPNLKMLDPGMDDKMLAKILTEKTEAGFFAPDETLSEAESELLAYLQRKKQKGDRIKVKDVIDDFAAVPYGWWNEGSLCVLAKLVARGKIDLKKESDYLDRAGVLSVFKNSREYPNTVIELRETFSQEAVRRLKDLHNNLFNEANTKSEAKDVALAFEERLRKEVESLDNLLYKADRYPFDEDLRNAVEELRKFLGKDYTFYLNEMMEYEDRLQDLQENTIEPIKNFIKGPRGRIYDDIKDFLGEQGANFSFLDQAKVSDLKKGMSSRDIFKNTNLQDAKALFDGLKKELEKVLAEEKQKALEEIDRMLREMRSLAEYPQLAEEQQKELENPFEQIGEKIREVTFILLIKDHLETFKKQSYPGILEKLHKITLPPVIDENRVGIPVAPRNVVTITDLKIKKKKPMLTTESDVEEFLEAWREVLIERIKDGDSILIQD